ncbi:hypothetical protein C8Q80DRAFT_851391 [Daedaleopsis nitida]|nr:hypothetical protein C8Q80DRAFT_851391 [Daedaleopsis nitida]
MSWQTSGHDVAESTMECVQSKAESRCTCQVASLSSAHESLLRRAERRSTRGQMTTDDSLIGSPESLDRDARWASESSRRRSVQAEGRARPGDETTKATGGQPPVVHGRCSDLRNSSGLTSRAPGCFARTYTLARHGRRMARRDIGVREGANRQSRTTRGGCRDRRQRICGLIGAEEACGGKATRPARSAGTSVAARRDDHGGQRAGITDANGRRRKLRTDRRDSCQSTWSRPLPASGGNQAADQAPEAL